MFECLWTLEGLRNITIWFWLVLAGPLSCNSVAAADSYISWINTFFATHQGDLSDLSKYFLYGNPVIHKGDLSIFLIQQSGSVVIKRMLPKNAPESIQKKGTRPGKHTEFELENHHAISG